MSDLFYQRYKFGDLIGKGAFGSVYNCHKILTKEEFAVKVIPASDPSVEDRIDNREVEIVNILQHDPCENVILVIEVFRNQESGSSVANSNASIVPRQTMIVMERGKSNLKDYFKSRRKDDQPFTEMELLDMMHQIFRGLYHLKQHDVFHRDLKPQNIIVVQRDGRVIFKIADFGCSKCFLEERMRGNHLKYSSFNGTPRYFSPEAMKYYEVVEDIKKTGDESKLSILRDAMPDYEKSDVWTTALIILEAYLTRRQSRDEPEVNLAGFNKQDHAQKLLDVVNEVQFEKLRKLLLKAFDAKSVSYRPSFADYLVLLGQDEELSAFQRIKRGEYGAQSFASSPSSEMKTVRYFAAGTPRESQIVLESAGSSECSPQDVITDPHAQLKRLRAEFDAYKTATEDRHRVQIEDVQRAAEDRIAAVQRALGEEFRRRLQVLRDAQEDFLRESEGALARAAREASVSLRSLQDAPLCAPIPLTSDGPLNGEAAARSTQKYAQRVQYNAPGQEFLCVGASPDGSCKFVVGCASGDVYLCSGEGDSIKAITTTTPLHRAHTDSVLCVAFSAKGDEFATGSADKAVVVWRAEYGDKIVKLNKHEASVRCVAYSCSLLVSGGDDKAINVWDTHKNHLYAINAHATGVLSVAFSPEGSELLSCSAQGHVKVWDTATRRQKCLLYTHAQNCANALTYMPDGKQFAACTDDGSLHVWRTDSAHAQVTTKVNAKGALSVAYAPDAAFIAVGGADGTVHVLDARTNAAATVLKGHALEVTGVAYAASGKALVSCSKDGSVSVWNV